MSRPRAVCLLMLSLTLCHIALATVVRQGDLDDCEDGGAATETTAAPVTKSTLLPLGAPCGPSVSPGAESKCASNAAGRVSCTVLFQFQRFEDDTFRCIIGRVPVGGRCGAAGTGIWADCIPVTDDGRNVDCVNGTCAISNLQRIGDECKPEACRDPLSCVPISIGGKTTDRCATVVAEGGSCNPAGFEPFKLCDSDAGLECRQVPCVVPEGSAVAGCRVQPGRCFKKDQ